MSETTTRTVKMNQAKPSQKDMAAMYDFFNQWEALKKCWWEPEEDDWREEWGAISTWKDENSTTKEEVMIEFFDHWIDKIGHRWRRVVFGMEMLMDNCCDPELDHLDWRPDIKEFLNSKGED